ncbi:hypothetical protein EJ05DRAFT_523464 [Pseudovirgaria hyperparasitica]|uniref:Zn(2)-C6 fungal-type domain-containing protein n=1 Tax=Pseudovirgaria hyperparasitica TaxID=470096 RepID=A0A6A6VTY5_9PEZI|nr:uncharacterized protein EJ05DRAFT_523464 [Pseudovirgaria hyperparasitica]KAF2753070.1 hypothetical protein EJ05DRAFT_523464 [Pseudovirgaria hyperparasitica]
MFGTWRYDPTDNKLIGIQDSSVKAKTWNRGKLNSACKACKDKKLRCTAQRTGCDRCKANGTTCIYVPRRASSRATTNPHRAEGESHGGREKTVEKADSRYQSRSSSSPVGDPSESEQLNGESSTLASGMSMSPAPSLDSLHFLQEAILPSGSLDIFEVAMQPDYSLGGGGLEFELSDDNNNEDNDDNDNGNANCNSNSISNSNSSNSNSNVNGFHVFDQDQDLLLSTEQDLDSLGFPLPTPSDSTSPPRSRTERQPPALALAPEPAPAHLSLGPDPFTFTGSPRPRPSHHRRNTTTNIKVATCPCSCLQNLAALLERLMLMTSGISTPQTQSLDVQLAIHKAALARCDAVLCCTLCDTRSENTMLLITVCERIVDMCANIVDTYHLHLDADQSATASLDSLLQNSGASAPSIPESASSSNTLVSGPVSPLSVGSFQISSMNEWAAVIRTIIRLQLQRMGSLLGRMKSLSTGEVQDVHSDMLKKLRDRVRSLLHVAGGGDLD